MLNNDDRPESQEKLTAARSSQALERNQWLTLKDASDFLGVHFTTLRTWADNGEIPVFRTPGGHRRFSLSDLRRFLESRVEQEEQVDPGALVDAAIVRVRKEMERRPEQEMRWISNLSQETRAMNRERGRQLFALAIAYVLKPNQRESILMDGRNLGWEYGREAASNRVNLAETGRAVQFFRTQLVQVARAEDGTGKLDDDDIRIQRLINHFLDEVLYAVLNGYEQRLDEQLGNTPPLNTDTLDPEVPDDIP